MGRELKLSLGDWGCLAFVADGATLLNLGGLVMSRPPLPGTWVPLASPLLFSPGAE